MKKVKNNTENILEMITLFALFIILMYFNLRVVGYMIFTEPVNSLNNIVLVFVVGLAGFGYLSLCSVMKNKGKLIPHKNKYDI